MESNAALLKYSAVCDRSRADQEDNRTSPFNTTYGLLGNDSRGTMISSEELDLKKQKEMVSASTLLQEEDD